MICRTMKSAFILFWCIFFGLYGYREVFPTLVVGLGLAMALAILFSFDDSLNSIQSELKSIQSELNSIQSEVKRNNQKLDELIGQKH
jgi:hypothetical protein